MSLRKFWDTNIGRKGLFGEGMEMLGLGMSGTTRDRRAKGIRGLNFQRDYTNQLLKDGAVASILRQNQNIMPNAPQGGLARDNSRGGFINQIIAQTIRAKNDVFNQTNMNRLKNDTAYDDKVRAIKEMG